MTVSIIAAMDKNQLIGIDNDMPWYLPKDFAYFKKTTGKSPVIMGRLTYESIGKILPNRTNIIVSSNPTLYIHGALTVTTIEDAIRIAKSENTDECFIIGGGQIYKQVLEDKIVDKLYITSINTYIDIDKYPNSNYTYFPEFTNDNWDLLSVDFHEKDEKNEYGMHFLVFERNF